MSHKTSDNYIFHNRLKSEYLHLVVMPIFSIFFLLSTVYTQDLLKEFDISIKKMEKGISAQPNSSILIIQSTIPDLSFESNKGIKNVENVSSGEWKLILYPGNQRITIKSEGFISYSERITLQKQKVYKVIVNEKSNKYIRNLDEDLYEVSFKFNVSDVYCSINDYAANLSIGNMVIFKLPASTYNFRFNKNSFKPLVKTVTITSDTYSEIVLQRDTQNKIIKTLPGVIVVETDPINAEIILDGQKYGYTPKNISGITEGIHQLEIRKNKYLPELSTFDIRGGDIKTLSITLKPNFGYFTARSIPDSCEIYFNDKFVGFTPINNLEYEVGIYNIKAKKELYRNYVFPEFKITNGSSKYVEFELEPAFGSLKIESLPISGVNIILDGNVIGKTPYINEKFPDGDYTIQLEKESYYSITDNIKVQNGELTSRTYIMNSNSGTISVTNEDINIFIDDNVISHNHDNIKLLPGIYIIRAEKDGYYPEEKEISVSLEKTEYISFQLQPMMASLSIMVEPIEFQPNSEIFINDSSYGEAPVITRLPVGIHNLIAIIGDKKYSKNVNIEGQDLSVIFNKTELDIGSINFVQTFGGNYDDYGYSVTQTRDDGYILVGSISNRSNESDIYLIKTDSLGKEEWYKTFGLGNSNEGRAVIQTKDGGFIVLGNTDSYWFGGLDIWLIKTDSLGNKEWEQFYGGVKDDGGYSVQNTNDSGYIISGYTKSVGNNKKNAWLIKTDSLGNKLWEKTYGGKLDDEAFSVVQTKDNEYIISGYTTSRDKKLKEQLWLIKTSKNGNILWEKANHYKAQGGLGNSVVQTSDGSYVITGKHFTSEYNKNNVALDKLDANGIIVWEKSFSNGLNDYGNSLLKTNDGGFVVVGYTTAFGIKKSDVLLIRTNADGELKWKKSIGGKKLDFGVSICSANDGGFVIIGTTESKGNGGKDILLIKTDKEGNVQW